MISSENFKKHTGMSKNLYVFSLCIFTSIGIAVSFGVSRLTTGMQFGWSHAIGVLILGIVGIVIAKLSSNWLISFLGYMLIAVPYGALLGPIINTVLPADIAKAFFVTTLYVVVTGVIGAVIPDNLQNWRGWLLSGLIIALIGYFVMPLAGFFGISIEGALGIWDWVVVALFGAIIIYDINRGLRLAYTLDNSVDTAISVYLSWLNVFLRINRND